MKFIFEKKTDSVFIGFRVSMADKENIESTLDILEKIKGGKVSDSELFKIFNDSFLDLFLSNISGELEKKQGQKLFNAIKSISKAVFYSKF